MQKEEGKYVRFRNGDIQQAYVNPTPKDIKVLPFLWYTLTSKSFRWKMVETLKYALMHYDSYRGDNASDVCLFKVDKDFHKVWK